MIGYSFIFWKKERKERLLFHDTVLYYYSIFLTFYKKCTKF